MAEFITFFVAAVVIVTGGLGVIAARNPVHSALFLIQTLIGVAVLFVIQEAHFLAAVQVVVYAGAIVILFLFVIMLLGVDKAEDLGSRTDCRAEAACRRDRCCARSWRDHHRRRSCRWRHRFGVGAGHR